MNIYVYILSYNDLAGNLQTSICRTTDLTSIPSGTSYVTCTGIDMVSPIILSNGTYVLDTATILSNAQTAQYKIISAKCAAAILAGITSSASGSPILYTMDDVDQTNFLKASIEANQCLNTAVPWTAGMTVPPLGFMVSAGNYYVNLTAGTTGATLPTLPNLTTTYGQTVTDNTVLWIQVFDMISTNNTPVFLNPPQIKQLFNDVSRFILNNRIRAFGLCAQINNATTISAVQAIVW